jgi:hypothetical protein
MSLGEYETSQQLYAQNIPFNVLIMTAMEKASPENLHWLIIGFPAVYRELCEQRSNTSRLVKLHGPNENST